MELMLTIALGTKPTLAHPVGCVAGEREPPLAHNLLPVDIAAREQQVERRAGVVCPELGQRKLPIRPFRVFLHCCCCCLACVKYCKYLRVFGVSVGELSSWCPLSL